MKKGILIDIAIARTARNYLLKYELPASHLAEKLGIDEQDFHLKLDITNPYFSFTPRELSKLQKITNDKSIIKAIALNNRSAIAALREM